MCDVSDGLLSELAHIAQASSVGIEIDSKLISANPDFKELLDLDSSQVWRWILGGGEDHVFVATTSAKVPDGAIVIGKVVSGTEVSVLGISDLPDVGFRHF